MSKTNSVRRKHAAKLARGGFRSGWSRRRLMPRTKFHGHGPYRNRWGMLSEPVTPKLVAAVFDPRRTAPDGDPSPAYPSRASRRMMRAGGMKNTATARKELAKFTDDFRRWRLRGDNLAWAIASGDPRIGIVRMPEGWYVR